MHDMLAQQLRQAGVSAHALTPELRHLLDLVDAAYLEADAERALAERRQAEALGSLAGGVAHEFNNIIAAVLSYADLAADALGSSHPVAEDLEAIGRAARRAAAFTQLLLAFSRSEVAPGIVALVHRRGSGPRPRTTAARRAPVVAK